MTIQDLLTIISKSNKHWINMVKSFGASHDVAEEIVQGMYLRIYDLVKDPDKIMYTETEVNKQYIFIILRNEYFSLKGKKKIKVDYEYDLNNCEILLDENIEERIDDIELLDLISEEMKEWTWYDNKMYTLYYIKGYTMKKLSEETGISISSIFNTLKSCRTRIKNKFNNLYYINLAQ